MQNAMHSSSIERRISMAYLDDFLLQEIFVRLPVKSVHRFKCVSKHWLSLISDSSFVHEYVQFQSSRIDDADDDEYKNLYMTTFIYMGMRAHTPSCLDFPSYAFEYEGFYFEFIPTKFQQLRLKLLAASHGWILCSSESSKSGTGVRGWEHDYHLCNPLFKQWIDIPRPPKPKNENRNVDEYSLLGFMCENDLISSSSNNGLAVKPIQFKVVKMINYLHILSVIIFSSESWEWSISTITKPRNVELDRVRKHMSIQKPCMVPCDGTLYWMTKFDRCVFALNLNNDGDGDPLHLRCIPLPVNHVCMLPLRRAQLGLCKGQIHLSRWDDWNDWNNDTIISIWQLIKERGQTDHHYQWSLKHRITISGLYFFSYCVLQVEFAPLDEDIAYLVLTTQQVFLLNLKNKTVMQIDCDDIIVNCIPFVLPYWPLPLQSSNLQEENRQY